MNNVYLVFEYIDDGLEKVLGCYECLEDAKKRVQIEVSTSDDIVIGMQYHQGYRSIYIHEIPLIRSKSKYLYLIKEHSKNKVLCTKRCLEDAKEFIRDMVYYDDNVDITIGVYYGYEDSWYYIEKLEV